MGARGVLRTIEGGLLAFWCPGCQSAHAVDKGWTFNGNYDKPTFTPSILIRSGHYCPDSEASKHGHCWCNFAERFPELGPSPFKCYQCHSFVTDGMIQLLGDCSHSLAGQTVELKPWE